MGNIMVICRSCKIKMHKDDIFTRETFILVNWRCGKCDRLYQIKKFGRAARYHLDADYRKAKIENAKQSRKSRNETNN
jgi:hypothetical protein